ncbi:flavoprotein [Kribbella pittospori]|uniref:Flavoprotein n=1 Tax=Kribbella pittospori TaxID=722689 RepID=A0A4R0KAZ5_9ACTN|nr:flavoprotein [Kribbella pittospori]TCC56164.1 flavoprotein [Kribbella pittospori]
MSKRTLILVACGAPLASRLADGVRAARERDWDPYVVPTDAAMPWLEEQDLADVPVIVGNRRPHEPRRTPTADAVAVVPATFHTLNAWATGNASTYPLTTLCAALGSRTPTVAVPYASHELTNHPAWPASLAVLRHAGVRVVDPHDGSSGSLEPVTAGTGSKLVDGFRWDWVFEQIALAIRGGHAGRESE